VLAALSGALIWFGAVTVDRAFEWNEPVLLWQDTILKSPEFAPAYNEYGLALMRMSRFDEAKVQFERAIALGYTERPRRNLAFIAKHEERDARSAEQLLQAEYESGVRTRFLYTQLAGAKLELAAESPQRHDEYLREAIKMYELAYDLDPAYHLAHYRIGQLLLTLGDYDLARQHFEHAAGHGGADDFFVEPSRRIVEKLKFGSYAASPRRSS
jgi:tetratricopeptide (TPR) repeat protein